MEDYIKCLITGIAGVLLTALTALLGGFMLMKFYEWCIMPIGSAFNFTFPYIKYGLFVMLDVGICMLKYNIKDLTNNNSDVKDIITFMFAKVYLLILLWIISLIIL